MSNRYRVIPAFIHVPLPQGTTSHHPSGYGAVDIILQFAQRELGAAVTLDETTRDRLGENLVFDRRSFDTLPEAQDQ